VCKTSILAGVAGALSVSSALLDHIVSFNGRFARHVKGLFFYVFIYCSYSLEPVGYGRYRKEISINGSSKTDREGVMYSHTPGTRTSAEDLGGEGAATEPALGYFTYRGGTADGKNGLQVRRHSLHKAEYEYEQTKKKKDPNCDICSIRLANRMAGSQTFCPVRKLFALFANWRTVREPANFCEPR